MMSYSPVHLFSGGTRPEPTGNAVSTARLSTALGDKWRAFDALPPTIRQALAQANVDLCPHNISAAWRRVLEAALPLGLGDQAVELYLEQFMKAQVGEIEAFSEREYCRFGRHSAHIEAGATMLTEHTRPAIRRRGRARLRKSYHS